MNETFELALLGNPELRLAGQFLTKLRSAKAYALLYYLAVTRRTQPRTVLAGLFWGDVDEYYARRNLNRTLSDLTKVIGDHLVVERHSLAFARNQSYWLDVEALEAAATTTPTHENVARLAATADLYRGDFLNGFYVQDAPEFEQWVLNERTRLRAGILQLYHALSEFYAEQGDLLPAMEYARRILQLEPWREEAHRQLMLLLAQSGQRSAALAQYELCRQALRSELDVEPDAATLELVERIRTGSFDKPISKPEAKPPSRQADEKQDLTEVPAPSALPVPHNLPSQRTPFVGRAAELADMTRLLVEENDCRLLTLIGPGGMGKTRLALKVAEGIVARQIVAGPALQQPFRHGIFFVPLENVSNVDGLVAAIVSVLVEQSGFPLHSATPLQTQLVAFLRSKAMLLVLDNFEHLVKDAELCSTLLAAAPNVKLLVTSRETLGLQEAWFYPLVGLTIPNSALSERQASPVEYDAVRLFAQCARRTRPDFALAAERAAVLRICTLVEGMPLGIELAATWLKVMNCEQIAAEIARGLDFLTARYQNIPARHRSMRAVMEHTWTLLALEEGDAIARLAIFRGRFRQEAASAVTGTTLFTLATLVEKALLRVTADGYYQLHELTRQYAEAKLTSTANAALRDVHALYYANLLAQQRIHLFTKAHRQVWVIVGGELDNIRHAWQWGVDAIVTDRQALSVTRLLRQMTFVFAQYYIFQSLSLSGQALFVNMCEVAEAAGWATNPDLTGGQHSPQATFVHLRLITGLFHLERGHFRASLAVAEASLVACRALALDQDLLLALLLYGRTQMRRGAATEATLALQEALALAQRLASLHHCADALLNLGMVASGQGAYSTAQAYLQEGLTLCLEMGYRPWVARALSNLGTTYSRQYDFARAQPYYEQALAIAQEEGDQSFVMIITSNLGGLYGGIGRHALSVDYYQRSLATARSLGDERWIAANLNGLSATYLAMVDLPSAEHALREALTVGQRSDSTPDTLGSIGRLGHLFARRGHLEAALKALAFVEQHPVTMERDRLYNQPLLTELRSELDPTWFEQAAAWAANQTLDHMIDWLLHGEGSSSMTVRPLLVEEQGQSLARKKDGRG